MTVPAVDMMPLLAELWTQLTAHSTKMSPLTGLGTRRYVGV